MSADLARRALAAGFRWEAGVRWTWTRPDSFGQTSGRVHEDGRAPAYFAALPDLTDAATLGVLARQTRAAWAAIHPGASFGVVHLPGRVLIQVEWGPGQGWTEDCPTETEALIAALEAAKEKTP